LIRKVGDHVRKVHKVQTPTDTIINFVKKNTRA
jgi:predicted small metal-binding protein